MNMKKGFILIVVIAFLAVLIITAVVIVSFGCSEMIQTRARNDSAAAYYTAVSGAEMMFARLRSLVDTTVMWPQSISGHVNTQGAGSTSGNSFNATADTISQDVLGIVSEGIANGRHARVTVKYGFNSTFTSGFPIGCMGPIDLKGAKLLFLKSWVRAEGPIASGSTVTTNSVARVSGDILQNQSFQAPSFWQKYDTATSTWSSKAVGDTNGDGSYLIDITSDSQVTVADAGGDQAKIDIFTADDTYTDGVVNEKDAYYTYYTSELNSALGLGIGPGEEHYYSGSQVFEPDSVPAGTSIIFVNGDVDISFSDTEWWGGAIDHTIVTMGDISIIQPTNGSDDVLTLVAYGDVTTGGVRAFGGVRGEFVVYANGNFNAYYGGRTDGTIFAKDGVLIDTVLPIPGLLNRDLNRSSLDWADPANWPIGLPPGYNRLSLIFTLTDESADYAPRWQNE